MISGILWRIVLVAIALVAVGVHLDRETLKTPSLAGSVPEPFRNSAQSFVAAKALNGSNGELALAEAERLVQLRPLPAEHLRLLAQAQFAAGEVGQSAMSIQLAAQRGWRDPLAQESLLRLALDAGDTDVAARRYIALFLRRQTEDALLEELGPAVFSDPGGKGREALVSVVAGGKRWHRQFLARGARVLPPDAFTDVVSKVTATGERFECRDLRTAFRPLNARDAKAGAQFDELVESQC